MIERLSLDYDGPDGYTLTLDGDIFEAVERYMQARPGGLDYGRIAVAIDEGALLAFLASPAVKAALAHEEEGRREFAAYTSASPEERAQVLGEAVDEVGREMYGEEWGEAEREAADHFRKAAKENP